MSWNWRKVNKLFKYLDHNGFKVTQCGVRNLFPGVGFGVYAEVNHLNSNSLVSLFLPDESAQVLVWTETKSLWTTFGMELEKSLVWSLTEVANGI